MSLPDLIQTSHHHTGGKPFDAFQKQLVGLYLRGGEQKGRPPQSWQTRVCSLDVSRDFKVCGEKS